MPADPASGSRSTRSTSRIGSSPLDQYLVASRSRFGGRPIPRKEFIYELLKSAGVPRGYSLIADQMPKRNERKYWTRFLGRETAFYVGADQIARYLDAPVVYVAMRRVRRGHYSVRFEVLAEPPYDSGGTGSHHGAIRAADRAGGHREPGGFPVAPEALEVSAARR